MAVEKIEVILEDVDTEEVPVVDIEQNDMEHRDVVAAPGTSEDTNSNFVLGSFKQAYLVDTFLSYIARSSVFAVTTPVITMKALSPTFKSLFIAAPIVSNLLVIIPMNWRTNKTGAKKEALALFVLSAIGMITVTTLSATTDLHTVSTFDWRYGLMLGSGFLVGSAAGALQLISDALKWTPKKEYVPDLQLLYSFLVDSSSVTTPLVVYFFGELGYYKPLSIYTGLSLAGLLLTYSLVNPSPYHQFRTIYPHDMAKEFAIQAGQLPDMIKDYDNVTFMDVLRENLTVLTDRRLLLLAFSVFASLGNLFISKTILPNLLMGGFGLSLSNAVVTSVLATLASLIARPIASKMILWWDNESGGVKIHLLGCALTFSGAMALATATNIPTWGLYVSLACAFTGFGITTSTASSIAVKWSDPVGGSLKKINPGTMFNLFGTIGSLGGIFLPLLLSLLIDQSGTSWYQQYFYIIIGMMVISSIGVPIVNHQVHRRQDESFFNSTFSFFNNMTNRGNNQTISVIPSLMISQANPSSPAPIAQSTNDDSSSDEEFFVNGIL